MARFPQQPKSFEWVSSNLATWTLGGADNNLSLTLNQQCNAKQVFAPAIIQEFMCQLRQFPKISNRVQS